MSFRRFILASMASAAASVDPPVITDVDISPTWAKAGDTFTCTPTATNSPSSYAYQWTNNGVDISGATSATFANDGSYGTNALNCTVTATNAAGTSDPEEADADVTMAWVGYVASNYTTSASNVDVDCGTPMVGQSIWFGMVWNGSSPSGNITIEGNGPTAIASHAYVKGNVVTGSRRMLLYALTTSDQTISFTKSTTTGSWTRFYKSVGFELTAKGLVAAGQASSNSTGVSPTINIAETDALFALGLFYDALSDPSNVDYLEDANFEEYSFEPYDVAGTGIATADNAALAVAFSVGVSQANKAGYIWGAAAAA